MKQTDYPEEDARTLPFEPEKKEAPARGEKDPSPRYLDLPTGPPDSAGRRNIALGITCLALAAIAFWLGLYYAGANVARTLAASLGTFGILLLLGSARVLGQRHGRFLALGVIALFGAAIPFIEGGFRKVDAIARESLGGQPATPAAALPPPPTAATAPPAPAGSDLPEAGSPTLADHGKPSTRPQPVDDGPPRELMLPAPPADAGKLVRLKEDVKVILDGRQTILRAGTVAPFKSLEDGKVTFLANGSEVSIDMGLVVFTGATRERPEDITRLAQEEVRRRYPKIAEPDSRENALFVTRYKEIAGEKEMSTVFFADPKWPLVLAEQIATQEGWLRADIPQDESPAEAPPAEIPANELPANTLPPAGKPLPALPPADFPPPADNATPQRNPEPPR